MENLAGFWGCGVDRASQFLLGCGRCRGGSGRGVRGGGFWGCLIDRRCFRCGGQNGRRRGKEPRRETPSEQSNWLRRLVVRIDWEHLYGLLMRAVEVDMDEAGVGGRGNVNRCRLQQTTSVKGGAHTAHALDRFEDEGSIAGSIENHRASMAARASNGGWPPRARSLAGKGQTSSMAWKRVNAIPARNPGSSLNSGRPPGDGRSS